MPTVSFTRGEVLRQGAFSERIMGATASPPGSCDFIFLNRHRQTSEWLEWLLASLLLQKSRAKSQANLTGKYPGLRRRV